MVIQTATRFDPSEVIDFAQSLKSAFFRKDAANPEKLEISVGEPEPGVIECKVVITGQEPGDEHRIAQHFVDKGWTCNSTGAHEVTCRSPDDE